MLLQPVYFWKKSPFIRLLVPLIIGILTQWHCQLIPVIWYFLFALSTLCLILFQYFPLFSRYRLAFINGFTIFLAFIAIGALLVWLHDVRKTKNWVGHHYTENNYVVAVLNELPAEKNKSFKATASITSLVKNNKTIAVKGKLILYFKKDSLSSSLENGSVVIFKKPLQEIKNSGNPGGFDYKRYSLFNGITHQVYLKTEEFILLPAKNKKWFSSFLDDIREQVLTTLRTNIKGEKEVGLAEALLIGYKDDLDKTLVQSYTNTGVVHIIAISGLHLGLIYWLLVQLLKPMKRHKYVNWVRPVIIICCLWLFSLLAGAQPSILRSAVMFTCIVLGENISKKTSIYNTLAFSAFILLCYNPYWLWDVGFQLSYSAVLSIIIFMRPIYNLLYFKNKIFDFFWKLNAVTLAAQILTLPVSIFHFHQFPCHFLLTNFVAVPLSSAILLGEILLCILSFIPVLALVIGKLLSWLIWLMNAYIERMEALPFSLWDGLQLNIPQVILLFVFITAISFWLLEKKKAGFITALITLLSFFMLRTVSFLIADKQQKIIVYNVPQQRAIDFVNGRNFFFAGDTNLLNNDFARNFHLKPSRIMQRIESASSLNNLMNDKNYYSFASKKIMLLDSSISFHSDTTKYPVDLLVISKNPKLYISQLNKSFAIKQIVFDGTVSPWRSKYWKKDCDSLHISYHDVAEKGAFVMTIK